MEKIVLRLYVIGKTPRSLRAIKNIRELCSKEFTGEVDLDIIDVAENPQLAEDGKIIAAPTLLKMLPAPVKRIIGDFSNKKNVLLCLDLTSFDEQHD